MSTDADVRLQRLLGGDGLAPLRKRLRQRFERAPAQGGPAFFRLGTLTAGEHAALAGLLGRSPRPSGSIHVDVARIDAALQAAGLAPSLRHALELLDGPIAHIAAVRDEAEALWSRLVAACSHPGLAALLGTPPGHALLKRLSGRDPGLAARACRDAEAVLHRLPAAGIPRSQLAAEALGDAHALDSGRPPAALVLAVWRRLTPAFDDGLPAGSDQAATGDAERPERTRDVWASAGVLVNELARPVLFLNLPMRGAPGGSEWGEPAYASLRRLLRSPPALDVARRRVHVCENPNLLAIAADRLGHTCAPLVCTDGMPAAAQRCLLSQLVRAGARLAYHGDFDWPGVRIGNQVMRAHGARPWRLARGDYEAAVDAAPRGGHPLTGDPVEASWDGTLMGAMRDRGIAIAEEALASVLLQDLGDG